MKRPSDTESYADELSRILELLQAHPRGMSVSDIAAAIAINRNTASRYLDMLRISGQVEMKTYGKAKVFYISQRVPISAMLNFSSDLVAVLDRDERIIQINDAACAFFNTDRDALLGRELAKSPLAAFDHPLIWAKIREALGGTEVVEELRFFRRGEELFFRMKVIPTVFNDGTPGVTIILEEITEEKRAEEALRESEQMFRNLVENINDVIWNVNGAGVFIYMSPKCREVLGYAPDDMIGRSPRDFMAADEAERVREHLAPQRSGYAPFALVEFVMLHRDGHPVTLEASGTPTVDPSGTCTGYRVICRDITDRKQASKRIEQWKLFLHSIVDNIPDMVVVKKLNDHRFIFFNRMAEDLLGSPGEDLYGRRAQDIFPDEMAAFFDAGGDRPERGETVVRTGDGAGRVLYVKRIPIVNQKGKPRYLLCIAKDITDRKRAEDLLIAQRDRAQSYLDVAGVMIAVINADGSIDLVNRRGCQILGYTEEEIAGKDWFSVVVPGQLQERLRSNFLRLMEGEIEPPAYERIPVVTRDGGESLILWRNALLRDGTGKVVAMVSSGEVIDPAEACSAP
ncbi:MAG: PAS domain S-box protein [Methanomicrobiaceae archaeon]|nr:PAS domain S-box protein [Methanomicrobiaceae archaeon]MDD5419786.1 PAS domain S-box protein [Methanomicrobiaceae archaeon]